MALLRISGLPSAASAAAAAFHADWLDQALALLEPGGDLVLIFPSADHTHTAWRLAMVQSLAREHAPERINGLVSSDEAAITAALNYLSAADGVTGQLLSLDSAGSETVLSPPS